MAPEAAAMPGGCGQQGGRGAEALSGMMAYLAELRARAAAAEAAAAAPPPTSARIWDEEGEDGGADGDPAAGAGAPAGAAAAAAALGEPRVTHEELRYSNGDVYKGEVLGGRLRHGAGTHEGADGTRYVGGWRLDLRHGRGQFDAANGTRYDGEWREDRAHGAGACTYPNGSRYEGDWEADARCGWGRLETADGQSYEGEWRGDKMHGQGKWTFADGGYYLGGYEGGERTRGRLVLPTEGGGEAEYHGEFKDGLKHGSGVAVLKGAYIYKGPFERDARHGAGGECSYADGGRYVGDWRRDAREGRGRMVLCDGTTYEGEWRGDLRHGQGACRYANGDRYSGSWVDGARAGEGRCAFGSGDKYAGSWAADVPEGVGTMAYANGDRYHGEWRAGRRHGLGLMAFADGASFRGRWEAGAWLQSAADPARCRLRGPGLARAIAGEAAAFEIQARDEDNNPRLSGGDMFVVTLLREAAAAAAAAPPPAGAAAPADDGGGALAAATGGEGEQGGARLEVVGAGSVEDRGDGSYAVAYRLDVAGRHMVAVTDADGAHVADSPYPLLVLPGAPAPARCTADGAGSRAAAAGAPAAFSVAARDAFGNACRGLRARELAASLQLRARLVAGGGGGGEVAVACAPRDGGVWECEFVAPRPGLFVLEVTARAAAPAAAAAGWRHVRGSPFGVRVAPAAAAGGGEGGVGSSGGATGSGGAAGVRDVVAWWGEVARRAYGAEDGDTGAFDGAGEGLSGGGGGAAVAPEAEFVAANPGVAVVERLEDLWLLSKLQQRRRGAAPAAAADGAPPGAAAQSCPRPPQAAVAAGAAPPPAERPSGPPPAAARVVEAAAAPVGEVDVSFLGVLDGMQTVRGVLEVDASPDLVYDILTDYDRCSEVFENISASTTMEEDGAKQVVQACSWRFLAFSGSFNVHLSVSEDAAARALVFRLVRSSFMRDFEGRWQVSPASPASPASPGSPGGRARIEHVLAVKPLMPIPAAVSQYTRGIFTRQVANILRDLERERSQSRPSAQFLYLSLIHCHTTGAILVLRRRIQNNRGRASAAHRYIETRSMAGRAAIRCVLHDADEGAATVRLHLRTKAAAPAAARASSGGGRSSGGGGAGGSPRAAPRGSPRRAAAGAVAFAEGAAARDPLGLFGGVPPASGALAAAPGSPAAAAACQLRAGPLSSGGGSADVEAAALSVLGHLAAATALAQRPRSHPLCASAPRPRVAAAADGGKARAAFRRAPAERVAGELA
ncbi:MAG: hypothetical protein J3K34DRAFT_456142 [Monoraphidium minutum]|nr:MAG: hypothetical protein J3K34DRAFT_456142 [Monoraphidium minutum]